jgi:hypothetical protein
MASGPCDTSSGHEGLRLALLETQAVRKQQNHERLRTMPVYITMASTCAVSNGDVIDYYISCCVKENQCAPLWHVI